MWKTQNVALPNEENIITAAFTFLWQSCIPGLLISDCVYEMIYLVGNQKQAFRTQIMLMHGCYSKWGSGEKEVT